MKFLCIKCDQGMSLKEVSGPDEGGSLAVVFSCPGCGHNVAMLTNAHETQLVASLGVAIGPDGKKQSKCPFTGAIREKLEQQSSTQSSTAMNWSKEAKERLEKIPAFVRPMAVEGVEKFAREKGVNTIDIAVLDQARESMGM